MAAAGGSGGLVTAQGGAVWPVRSGVVPTLADGFSARPETVADLGAALVTGAVVALVPARIAGERPGGWLESCGKTQLAVSVSESLWLAGRLDLLLWVSAARRASILSSYADAAAAVQETDLGGDGESVAARFAGWLRQTTRPWLVVMEDLNDPAGLDGLWPSGPAGRVLVTTADPAALSGEHRALVRPVGVYTPAEALTYLSGRLRPGRCEDAAALAADLGYEPLALAEASAVIANSATSCADYRDMFARKRAERAAAANNSRANGAQAGGPLASGSPAAGAITWAISAELAGRLSPGGEARALLSIAAFLDGRGIPAAVFSTAAASAHLAATAADGDGTENREGQARDALNAAEQAGLLTIDPANGVALVRMSQVVQAAVRAELTEETFGQATKAAADALAEAWPEDEQPAWLARTSRLCLYSLWQAAGDLLWAGGCHPVLLRAGRSLEHARLTGPAVAYWRGLAELSDRVLGPGHPDSLTARERLAEAYLTAGQVTEALSWFRWVLAERVRVLGPDHPSAVTARRDLGHALMAAGEFTDAVAALARVLGDYERTRGPDQPDTLTAQDELAAAYRAAGQFTEAARLYQRTLDARERVQGPEHPDTMTTRFELAGACLADGRYRHALSHYKRALADRERALGPDHPDTIAARRATGSAYHAAGRMASAVQLYEQNRESCERALGADHPDTLAGCELLASAYCAVGRVTDAVTLLKDTLARCERALPPGSPVTETVRLSLAGLTGG